MAQDWAQNRQGGQRREQNIVKHHIHAWLIAGTPSLGCWTPTWPDPGQQEGEGARARRKAWQEGGNSVVRELLTAQLRSAGRASDPQLSAPQPLARMIPAVVLLLLLLVEQAGERV